MYKCDICIHLGLTLGYLCHKYDICIHLGLTLGYLCHKCDICIHLGLTLGYLCQKYDICIHLGLTLGYLCHKCDICIHLGLTLGYLCHKYDICIRSSLWFYIVKSFIFMRIVIYFFGENDIFRPQEFVNLVVDHCIQYLKYILILELYSQLSTPMNPQWM